MKSSLGLSNQTLYQRLLLLCSAAFLAIELPCFNICCASTNDLLVLNKAIDGRRLNGLNKQFGWVCSSRSFFQTVQRFELGES